MQNDDKIKRLRKMLEQVAPEKANFESLATRERPAAMEVTVEGPQAVEAARRRAQEASAIAKMTAGRDQDLTQDETFTLEAIVLPERRPVTFVRGGTYDNIIAPWTHLNAEPFRTRLEPLIKSIGRIEAPFSGLPYGGTGFVVGPDLLMTNRHVALIFSAGLGTGIRFTPGSAAVDFVREVGTPEPKPEELIDVIGVEMIHPFWDMALLRVEGLQGRFPLPLSTKSPQEMLDDDVVVVGYPARDERNDLAVQDHVFGRKYNVKRFQPGKLKGRGEIRSFENRVNAIVHDSSTLGGNSGSAVIHVPTGTVIGLHFGGIYLQANYAVPTSELARDPRVVRHGLKFVGTVAPTTEWDSAWLAADAGESATRAAPIATHNGKDTMSWTIPIRIDISVGAAAPSSAGIAPATTSNNGASLVEAMKIPKIFGDLESRTGYNGAFLELDDGSDVPFPELTAQGKSAVAELDAGGHEIKYHKFSIVMHRARRLALFTAANVDWRIEQRLIRGKKPNRKELTGLGPNDVEKWTTDERLSADAQLPDVFFTKDGGAFDKGHLVRRDDVVWGSTFKDMQKANGDTFHTTNCSPQVKTFNQSAFGEENWGDLEVLVEKQTDAEKAIIFSGPVLQDSDPIFEGKDVGGGAIRLRIPQSFWKIIVVKEETGPGAYGFMLEQDLSAVPTVEEFLVPSEWQQHMRSIADIEAKLGGLAKLTWFKDHDRFGSGAGEAIRNIIK